MSDEKEKVNKINLDSLISVEIFTHPSIITYKNQEIIVEKTLIDSGASSCFIDSSFVKKFKIPTKEKKFPIQVEAVDGRALGSGNITLETIPVLFKTSGHEEMISFHVINSPNYPIVLGMSWFCMHNPEIDWLERKISFPDVSFDLVGGGSGISNSIVETPAVQETCCLPIGPAPLPLVTDTTEKGNDDISENKSNCSLNSDPVVPPAIPRRGFRAPSSNSSVDPVVPPLVVPDSAPVLVPASNSSPDPISLPSPVLAPGPCNTPPPPEPVPDPSLVTISSPSIGINPKSPVRLASPTSKPIPKPRRGYFVPSSSSEGSPEIKPKYEWKPIPFGSEPVDVQVPVPPPKPVRRGYFVPSSPDDSPKLYPIWKQPNPPTVPVYRERTPPPRHLSLLVLVMLFPRHQKNPQKSSPLNHHCKAMLKAKLLTPQMMNTQ